MKKKFIVFFFMTSMLVAFRAQNDFPVPAGWPSPVQSIGSDDLLSDRIALGRRLFYDPVLSADSTISCSSCHSPFSAFAHTDHALSHGIHDGIGNRNAPALFNLAWQQRFMWDGSKKSLEEQMQIPIEHPKEMGESLLHVEDKINHIPSYRNLFSSAFGNDSVSEERILHALRSFLLILVSKDSRYDQMKAGEIKFTDQESRGYHLFKAHCNGCHTEPLFTNGRFAYNGLVPDSLLSDMGRMAITRDKRDSLKFRIPTLRNIEFTYPYMHDGRMGHLKQVIDHYSDALPSGNMMPALLKSPLHLSSNEKTDLLAFLLTLSDKKFIFNKDFGFPQLEPLQSKIQTSNQ